MSARGLAAAVVTCLALTGCGGDTAPVDDEPDLAEALQQVDDSLAAEDYATAESALARLVDVAEQAEAEGTLSSAESDDIVSAAQALVEQLPTDQTEPPPPPPPPPTEPEPEPEPTVAPEPEDEDEDEDEQPKPPKGPKEPKGDKGPKGSKGKDDD